MEMEKREQDLIICSHLELHRRLPELKDHYKYQNNINYSTLDNAVHMTRRCMNYYFADIQICRSMYLFLHNTGIKRFKNLQGFYDEKSTSVIKHKYFGKFSRRSDVITSNDIETVVKFITGYAKKVAIPLPGRLPQFRDYAKVMKLPSSDTKISMYQNYKKVSAGTDMRVVGKSSFFAIWDEYCPHVMSMKPASDFCDVCRNNHLNLVRSANASVEEQQDALRVSMQHLEIAETQRERYNFWREIAKTGEETSLDVLSFDYAQNVSYPSSPQQVGSSYF